MVRPGNRWQCYFESCLVAGAGLQYSRAQPHQHRKKRGGEERGVAGNIKAASATKQKFMANHFQAKG